MTPAPRFWRAPNGVILDNPPAAGMEAVWWRCGARARAAGEPIDWAADALAYLIEAGQAGWDAMDARLRQEGQTEDTKNPGGEAGKIAESETESDEPNEPEQKHGGADAQRSIFE